MTLPFENDTRIIVKKLAKRSLQADKRRNIFLILTIILTTALLPIVYGKNSFLCWTILG